MNDAETLRVVARCPGGHGDVEWRATRREAPSSWTEYGTTAAPPRYEIGCDACEAAA